MSTRWWVPGPTLAVTMTSAWICAAFHIHFGMGKRAAGRANLMACVKGAMNAKNARRESVVTRAMIECPGL